MRGAIQLIQRIGKLITVVALALVLLFVTACSNNSNNGSDTPNNTSGNNTAQSENSTDGNNEVDAVEEGPVDPLGKYEPPISITTARFVKDGMEYPEGDSMDQNIWTRAYEDILGIKLTNEFISPDTPDVKSQKMSVTIASGELPDFIEVNPRELQMLVDANMIEDLTDEWDKYASPYLKEVRAANGKDYGMEAATFNGKLMAIPGTGGGGVDTAHMIWLRTDWLEKLKLESPKTMEDVIRIAEAFTKEDPDGNGEDDTFGMAFVGRNVYDGFAGIEGFMNGYHAYPYAKSVSMWIKGDDGKLVYGGIQPEVKEALTKLNEMFENGLLDPEFAVKDGGPVSESVNSEKVGLYFGQYWNASWPLNDLRKKNPEADWKPYPLVSVDGEPASPMLPSPTPTSYYVVKKGYENPEAIIKMLNLYYEKIYSENQEPDIYHTHKEMKDGEEKGYQVFSLAAIRGGLADNNIQAHVQVTEALKNGDPSGLKAEFQNYYDQIKAFREGASEGWWLERTFGEGGAYSVIKHYRESVPLMANEFYGAPTPTMSQVGSTLEEMEKEVFVRIIMGAAPLDDFDDYVQDWKNLGGDKITEEVNEWYQNKQ